MISKAEIKAMIYENSKRKAVLFSHYDPLTGEGSPIERKNISFKARGKDIFFAVPVQMYKDYTKFLDFLLGSGSIEEFIIKMGNTPTEPTISKTISGLENIRYVYDFEFWAYKCAKIQDKKTKQVIPFILNGSQRKLLFRLEKMRVANVPIRLILLKARQWGGSTLTQIYMAWIQVVHRTSWHSVVVADVENQARNINGMYSRFARLYPASMGRLKLTPYERSSKSRIIEGRDCVISIGSAQKPDNLRSFDLAMVHFCLKPGTLIPTKDGFLKKVENLIKGDEVLTHTGKLTRIKNITYSKPNISNGNGNAIAIYPWLGSRIVLTPNHAIWTKRGWVRAKELVKEDLLSMPIREITNEIYEIKMPFIPRNKLNSGTYSVANGAVIKLDKEIGFALGYYLAEGSLHKNKIGCNEVTLVRHDKETIYGDRAVAALTPYISSHTREKRKYCKTTVEHLYGVSLSRWINNELGTKEKKRIPDWFFKCGTEFLTGVLQGYMSGDGSKNNQKQNNYILSVTSVCTISSSLAIQIRDIAASLGFGWGAIDVKEEGNYYGRNCRKKYTVRWAGTSAKNIRKSLGWDIPNNGHQHSEKTFISERNVWIKIKKIENTKVRWVYDVEVEHEDHSFRTLYFSVKNSEVGMFKATLMKTPEELVQSIRAAVADVPYSMIVLESTARGVGNFFHREWQAAVNQENGYDHLFVPWFDIEMYQKDIKGREKFIEWIFTDAYAQFLWNLGATLEGINWYFDYKRREGYNDWMMQQEFPSTPEESFVSTGSRVFAPDYVRLARKNCMAPSFIGDISGASMKGKEALKDIIFQHNEKGQLFIWQMPDKEEEISDRYCVTVDIGGRTKDADFSVIKVFDRYWMQSGGKPETVATWKGHLDQDLLSWKAAQVSKFYNNALLVVESNSLDADEMEGNEGNHSLTILDEIAKFYPKLYARTDPEKVRQGLPIRYGFHTDRSTKPMIIDELNGALREEAYIERDERACSEMDTYEVKPNGKYGATEGCKDDLVMATAIGLWISFKFLPIPKVVVRQDKSFRNRIISEATI